MSINSAPSHAFNIFDPGISQPGNTGTLQYLCNLRRSAKSFGDPGNRDPQPFKPPYKG
jgi:hypothetical protein